LEIPFNAPLPPGEYFVNVDVVAEISSLYRIHRQRLVSEKLQVVQGPCAGAVRGGVLPCVTYSHFSGFQLLGGAALSEQTGLNTVSFWGRFH
jgi:hypothetical protein